MFFALSSLPALPVPFFPFPPRHKRNGLMILNVSFHTQQEAVELRVESPRVCPLPYIELPPFEMTRLKVDLKWGRNGKEKALLGQRVKERKGDAQDEAGFGCFNPAQDPAPGLNADSHVTQSSSSGPEQVSTGIWSNRM